MHPCPCRSLKSLLLLLLLLVLASTAWAQVGTYPRVRLSDGVLDRLVGITPNNALMIEGVVGGTALPVSQSGTWTVQPGNTQNTTPWLQRFHDGTNPLGVFFDLDTGAGTQWELGVNLRKSASGGSVEFGTATDPFRTDPTGTTTQPVSGTVTANQGTAAATPWNSNTAQIAGTTTVTAGVAGLQAVGGAAASGAAKSGNPVQSGGVFNTTQPTVTTGQAVEAQYTARGAAIAATGADTFNVTVNTALPAGSNVIGALTANQSVNTAQINGVAVSTGVGVSGTGVQRVVLASGAGATQGADIGQVPGGGDAASNLNAVTPNSGGSFLQVAGYLFNGTTWDRVRSGGATGAAMIAGAAASGTAKSGNPTQIGGVFNTTQPTVTTGQVVEAQATNRGAAIVATGADTFNVTVNAALPTGSNTIGALTANQSVNVAQVNGVATSTGVGVSGTGVQRVVQATNDPCQSSGVAKSSVVLNVTASAQIIAASGTTTIYVCGYSATVGGTAPTYQFQYGTGAVCATGLTNLTGTYAPTVGSFNSYQPGMTAFATTASQALCIATGGTGPSVQGVLTYVQQ